METTLNSERWSPATLIGFRFIFAYFAIYVAPFPLYYIPYAVFVIQPFSNLFFASTERFGRIFFGAEYVVSSGSTGSGDSMYHYVQLLFVLLLALIIAVIWSIVDRRRDNYEKLNYWFIIWLRYAVAAIMFNYGFAKVFRVQFPPLSIEDLNKTFGDSSPMNLLWTFMGYSGPYTIFTGLGEVIGGLLLLFKRTQLLGALVVAIVMINVVMINLAYDVPVKLYSTHILIMAILIMTPDTSRLANLFILNKSANPKTLSPIYNTQRQKWIYAAGKGIFLIYIVSQPLFFNLNEMKAITEHFSKENPGHSINGQYDVETFVLNNDTLPALQQDTRRWKTMMINGKKIDLQSMDGVSLSWHFLGHAGYRRMVIFSPDLSTSGTFTFQSDSTLLTIKGILNSDTLNVSARKKTANEFVLLSRGFHWVNEYPFNN